MTSCLSLKEVKLLQFEPYIEDHELDIHPKFAGFKIPYFALDGKIDPEVYRFRFVQTQPSHGFASITEEPKKPRRYGQPAGTDCGVYLPPILPDGLTWKQVAKDSAVALVITEGELKAACGCKLGIPTIGLGGVFNWRSSKNLQELLPILEKFDWMGRTVYIVFDSDSGTNPMVRIACSRLVYTLSLRGAVCRIVTLPPTADGGKQGMDDFIYMLGEEKGFEAFGELLAKTEDDSLGKELHRLNDEVGLIQSTSEIIELITGNIYSPSTFSESRYRNRTYHEHDDSGKMVKKVAAKEWLAWEHRTEFRRLVYEPSCNNLITMAGEYNTWYAQRWPLLPSRKGSIAPWQKLFDHVFSGLTDEQRLWAKQWLACPLQRPGIKMFTAMLVWGRTTGTGKSRIGETMQAIYGRNFGMITNDDLESNFTEWAENKQFIVGDEISMGDRRGIANKLKTLISRPEFRLNVKNHKSYAVKDCINYYFSSNHEDAMYLENHDRRFFVVHADVPRLEAGFYKEYMAWLRNGGAERLYHHLLHEVDLGDFNPFGEAPITAAKLEMMASGRSDVEDWAFQLAANPDKQLGDKNCFDLYTAKQLLRIYEPDERAKIKANGISRALNSAGVFKTANGSNHVYVSGARDTVYAVRNASMYAKMGPAEITKAYDKERANVPGPKFAANGTMVRRPN